MNVKKIIGYIFIVLFLFSVVFGAGYYTGYRKINSRNKDTITNLENTITELRNEYKELENNYSRFREEQQFTERKLVEARTIITEIETGLQQTKDTIQRIERLLDGIRELAKTLYQEE